MMFHIKLIALLLLTIQICSSALYAVDDSSLHSDDQGYGLYLLTPEFHQYILFTNAGDVKQSYYSGYGRSAFYTGPDIKCAYQVLLDGGLAMSQTDTNFGKSLTIAKDHKLFPISKLKENSVRTSGKVEVIIFKILRFDFLVNSQEKAEAFDSRAIERLNGTSIEMVPFKEEP